MCNFVLLDLLVLKFLVNKFLTGRLILHFRHSTNWTEIFMHMNCGPHVLSIVRKYRNYNWMCMKIMHMSDCIS